MRAFYGHVIRGTPVGVGFLMARLPLLLAFALVAARGASATACPRDARS
jgi:hypothetical protein